MKWHLLIDWLYLHVSSRITIAICFVSHPTKTNIYTAFQNENSVPCLTIIVNKRQLTMPYGGRNCKRYSLQAGILKNCDE
jgi:hypothetical protein